MIIYDVFSKFTTLYALKSLSTKGCLSKVMKDYIPKYGTPKAILSDNASYLCQQEMERALRIERDKSVSLLCL